MLHRIEPVPLSRRRVGLYLKLLHESNAERGMLHGQGPVPLSRRRVGLYLKLLHESNAEMRNVARGV
jgi:hypothetical protein